MKAIFAAGRVGKPTKNSGKDKNSFEAVNYILTLKDKDKHDIGARVAAVYRDLDDLPAVKDMTAADRKRIAKHIDEPSKLKLGNRGSHFQHHVICAPSGASLNKFLVGVKKAIKDFVKASGGGRYVAAVHVDCKHPHAHIIIDNFFKETCKRRNFNDDAPLSMEQVRSFDFTDVFEEGRSSKIDKVQAPTKKNFAQKLHAEMLRLGGIKNMPNEFEGWQKKLKRGRRDVVWECIERPTLKIRTQTAFKLAEKELEAEVTPPAEPLVNSFWGGIE